MNEPYHLLDVNCALYFLSWKLVVRNSRTLELSTQHFEELLDSMLRDPEQFQDLEDGVTIEMAVEELRQRKRCFGIPFVFVEWLVVPQVVGFREADGVRVVVPVVQGLWEYDADRYSTWKPGAKERA